MLNFAKKNSAQADEDYYQPKPRENVEDRRWESVCIAVNDFARSEKAARYDW